MMILTLMLCFFSMFNHLFPCPTVSVNFFFKCACFCSIITLSVKAWPNARNISTQHLATLLPDVATCVARGVQTHTTFSSFSTQHVNVHVPQAPGAQEVDLTRMP